jgi:hypothetical protein
MMVTNGPGTDIKTVQAGNLHSSARTTLDT